MAKDTPYFVNPGFASLLFSFQTWYASDQASY